MCRLRTSSESGVSSTRTSASGVAGRLAPMLVSGGVERTTGVGRLSGRRQGLTLRLAPTGNTPCLEQRSQGGELEESGLAALEILRRGRDTEGNRFSGRYERPRKRREVTAQEKGVQLTVDLDPLLRPRSAWRFVRWVGWSNVTLPASSTTPVGCLHRQPIARRFVKASFRTAYVSLHSQPRRTRVII